MHNPVGPWLEANGLYIEQSGLKEILALKEDELVIFDVGLGAAANSLAVLHAAKNSNRKLRLVSFEVDLTLLEFALENSAQFDHFFGFESAIAELLQNRIWKSEIITWELRHGDFLDLISQEQNLADLIFYDPYSPKMNKDMWTLACFKKLRAKCKDSSENQNAKLFTYSRATPIRSALLAAGFFVGSGIATGLKNETTQATTRLEDLSSPLGERWLKRWNNSSTRFPFDCTSENEAFLTQTILGHIQFKNLNESTKATVNE